MSNDKTLFQNFYSNAIQTVLLSKRDKALALVAAALAKSDAGLIKKCVLEAKQAGLSNTEILAIHATVFAVLGQHSVVALGGELIGPSPTPTPSKCCQ